LSMVDITAKPEVMRVAVAEGTIRLRGETIQAIREGRVKKGDVITAAKLAAVNAVKKTPELVFLAHPIPITDVEVSIRLEEEASQVRSRVTVKSVGKTGVELEAVLGVMASLLTIFDMCKYLEKDERGQYPVTVISDIRVVEKVKREVAGAE